MSRYFKYTDLQCDTCHRVIETLNDKTRILPSTCTITSGCLGHLSPVGRHDVRRQAIPPTVIGLNDRLQVSLPTSSLVSSQTAIISSGKYSLAMTGGFYDGQFMYFYDINGNVQTFGASLPYGDFTSVTQTLSLNLADVDVESSVDVNKFIYSGEYNQTTFKGRDITALARSLYIPDGFTVKVFIDGIESSFTAPDRYSVVLSSPLSQAAIIEIVVSSLPIDLQSSARSLTFITAKTSGVGLTLRQSSSWGDVSEIKVGGEDAASIVMFCRDISTLQTGRTYKITSATFTSGSNVVSLDLTKLSFLLASSPYGFVDKTYTSVMNIHDASVGFIKLDSQGAISSNAQIRPTFRHAVVKYVNSLTNSNNQSVDVNSKSDDSTGFVFGPV